MRMRMGMGMGMGHGKDGLPGWSRSQVLNIGRVASRVRMIVRKRLARDLPSRKDSALSCRTAMYSNNFLFNQGLSLFHSIPFHCIALHSVAYILVMCRACKLLTAHPGHTYVHTVLYMITLYPWPHGLLGFRWAPL
jgi:hypothetical protein